MRHVTGMQPCVSHVNASCIVEHLTETRMGTSHTLLSLPGAEASSVPKGKFKVF